MSVSFVLYSNLVEPKLQLFNFTYADADETFFLHSFDNDNDSPRGLCDIDYNPVLHLT